MINVRDNRDISKILNHFLTLNMWWRVGGSVARADFTTVDCGVGLVILPSFRGNRITALLNCTNMVLTFSKRTIVVQ